MVSAGRLWRKGGIALYSKREWLPPMNQVFILKEATVFAPVSYTHLDVYKRQASNPVGSGRYHLAGENLLEPNPHWYGGDTGKIKAIQLVEQPDRETSFYSMKTGSLDYLFVDGDETIAETGGSIHYVSMPNLIYIGINDSRTLLSDVRLDVYKRQLLFWP